MIGNKVWRKIRNDRALFQKIGILLSPVLNELETPDLAQSNRNMHVYITCVIDQHKLYSHHFSRYGHKKISQLAGDRLKCLFCPFCGPPALRKFNENSHAT